MGLLSDPEYGSEKWVRILGKVHGPLSFLCYIGALVWFVMLGNKAFNNDTYFSENALLPGLVTNEFNGENTARQFFNEFLEELEDKYSDTDEIPVPWLVGKMSQLSLEVYTHNFTLDYPLGHGQIYTGTNVYGILRAPRTSSLEALVVTAPFRSLSSHQKGTTAGIALMLAFAKFARSQKYWAKDIIFLVTEHEQLGMQAWLEAYHGILTDTDTFSSSLSSFWKPSHPGLDLMKLGLGDLTWSEHKKCLNPGKLKGRSGSIQAAINLEFHTPQIKYIEVKVEGLNGQLPNLDLVNLVHKLCAKSGIHHSYKNSYSWMRTRDNAEEWTNNVKTILGMVTTQLAGFPNGNHGLFHRFGIEAVTLEGRDADDPDGLAPRVHALSSCNFYRLGVALESILRSLNNLLERFHQSYFFYLLAGTNRFISIGQYMPSLCLFCVALLLKALALWVTIQQSDDECPKKRQGDDKKSKDETSKTTNIDEKSEKAKSETTNLLDEKPEDETSKKQSVESETTKLLGDEKTEDKTPNMKDRKKAKGKRKGDGLEEANTSIVSVGTNYLLVHLLGYAVMNSPVPFSRFAAQRYDFPTELVVYYSLLGISVLLVLFTPFLPRLLRKSPITHQEMSLINVLLLIELATVCMAVGMHNFPLGLCIAALYTPLALVVGVVCETKGILRSLMLQLKRAFCIVMFPLYLVTVCMMMYSGQLVPEDSFFGTLARGRDAALQAVMFSVVDSLIYGNWLFNVVASLLLPIWILFWQILCNKVNVA